MSKGVFFLASGVYLFSLIHMDTLLALIQVAKNGLHVQGKICKHFITQKKKKRVPYLKWAYLPYHTIFLTMSVVGFLSYWENINFYPQIMGLSYFEPSNYQFQFSVTLNPQFALLKDVIINIISRYLFFLYISTIKSYWKANINTFE